MKKNESKKNKSKIPFNKPFIVGREIEYIIQAVKEHSHLSGNGPFTKRCQSWLEKHLKCTKALLTHSCTGALEMSAILCNITYGDEVIMPSFTFVSTANAFVLHGAVPVFVDIRPDTLNIDETLIEDTITPRTRAIVPVHYAGIGCAMDKILDIAERHNLFVVEDAALGLLSTYKDRLLGTLGHLGCISFHETKNIISGEGGALLINDEQFVERAEIIWGKGTDRNRFLRGEVDKYTWIDIGSSFIPGELMAAFLWAQLEQADVIVESRRRLFNNYYTQLKPLHDKGVIRLPVIDRHNNSNGHIFYIITGSSEERTRLIKHLAQDGIKAVFHYIPLHSSSAGKKYGRANGKLPVTEDISSRLLRLPIYNEMRDEDISRVAEKVKSFYESKG